jgi:hypothetical protein
LNKQTYTIPGTALRFYPYQLFAVYWALKQPHGGLLADHMGLGKSFEVARLVAVRALLLDLRGHAEQHPQEHYGDSNKCLRGE